MVRRKVTVAAALLAGIVIGAGGATLALQSDRLLADQQTRDAVADVKRRIVQGHMKRDAVALSALYGDDYTAIDAKGVVRTKQDLLNALATDPEIVKGQYDLIAVRRWGNLAVATGRGQLLRRLGDGSSSPFDYYSFNVFELRNGRWVYVAAFLP
jgi:ketosteroid isomerase-like protein